VPAPAVGGSILVLEAEPGQRERWVRALCRDHALVEGAGDTAYAGELLSRCRFDALVVGLPPRGAALLEWACSARLRAGVRRLVVVAAGRSVDTVVEALRGGADEFLMRETRDDELALTVRRLLGPRLPVVPGEGGSGPAESALLGNSAAMVALRAELERIATRGVNVLVLGETGSGKETVARYLHRLSGRRGRFEAVNCGAIESGTLQRELSGAPDGAAGLVRSGHTGMLVSAAGGTLFLDNIGELSPDDQACVLKLLDGHGSRPVRADDAGARIVAGAHPDLDRQRRDGRFRADLYYRIGVVAVRLPPLRKRAGDIPLLAQHLVGVIAAGAGLAPREFGPRDREALVAHDWPGNVRELRNVIEHWILTGSTLADCLSAAAPPGSGEDAYPLSWSLRQVEDAHIARVLKSVAGNKSEAARRLGVSRKTLERRFRP